MGMRFMCTITLIAAILGSMMIAAGNRDILILVLTPVCWVLAIVAALSKP